jgi:hypothetical protein
MDDPIIELADLVTASLNDGDLGFTAVRGYLPDLKRKDLGSEIKVFVIPKAETGQPQSRSVEQVDFDIYIGVIKKLSQGSQDTFDQGELDDLRDAVRSIKNRLKVSRLGNYTRLRTLNDPLFDAEHLADQRQFTSIITVTYRGLVE